MKREWTPIILPMVRGCHISPPSPPPCYLSWWQGGGVELAEGSPSSWSCWFHGASLIWHLHAVASGQRVIDNSKDIHLELSMTRLTSDPLFKRNIIYLIIITIMMHLIIITIMMHWIIIKNHDALDHHQKSWCIWSSSQSWCIGSSSQSWCIITTFHFSPFTFHFFTFSLFTFHLSLFHFSPCLLYTSDAADE